MIPIAAVLLFAVTGCGGGGSNEAQAPAFQTVRGPDFRFAAPPGWIVTRSPDSVTALPKEQDSTLIKVYRFRTVKPYDPKMWPAAARELDGSAKRLVAALKGKLESARTMRVAGDRARQYVIGYSEKRGEYTFLYRGRREYELVCQWTDARPAACTRLTASFRLR